MLKHIRIRNFRSIRQADLAIAPITLLYGPNGSGKSSVLYALLIIKNFVLYSPAKTDNVFDFTFINLGSFEEVIHLHNPDSEIELEIACSGGVNSDVSYFLSIDKKTGLFGKVPFHSAVLNNKILRTIDIVLTNRGFFHPNFHSSSFIASMLSIEHEVATQLNDNPKLEKRVNAKFQTICKKELKVVPRLGLAFFHLQTVDKDGMVTNLCNESFGLNQVAFLLTKILQDNVSTILLEKPEIHLHPTTQYRLTRVLAEIAREEKKTLIIETHSETVLGTLLSLVREKFLTPDQIKAYYFTKPEKETVIKEQPINEDGQIEGGLASFMEANLEILKAYFKNS